MLSKKTATLGRRQFMKMAGSATAASVLVACAPRPTAAPVEPTKEQAATAQPQATAPGAEPAAQATPTPASGKLVVASFYPVDKVSGWDGLVKRFKESHPNTDLEVQVTDWDNYLPKLLGQVAGGDAPDVCGIENSVLPQFAGKGILEVLNPLFDATPGFALKDFFPHLVDRYTMEGDTFGVPYDAQPAGLLFFNPALFDAAGLSYPTDKWTWNDLLAAAQKLTATSSDGTVERFGVAMADWTYFLYTNGGLKVDDVRNPTKCLLDDPKAIEAIQFFVDMMHKYKVEPAPQTIQTMGGDSAYTDLFIAGKIAMVNNGFWTAVENPEAFRDLKVHMVMSPSGPGGVRLYPTGGTCYSIMKGSKAEGLAWQFLTFFLGPVGYEEAYKAATLGAIYPPAHIPSFEWYMQQKLEFIDTIEPNRTALDYIIFDPAIARWTEISSKCIDPDMDLILRAEKSVEATMKSIAQCVNTELASQG